MVSIRQLNLWRLVATFILFAISASVLGLIGSSLSWHASNKTRTDLPVVAGVFEYAYDPSNLRQGSYQIIIAAGCGGIIDAALLVFASLRTKPLKIGKWSFKQWDLFSAFLGAIRIAIGVAAIIFSFIQYYGSMSFVPGTREIGGRYQGYFTIEAWSCQVSRYSLTVDYGRYCQEGKAARWLLLPYTMVGIVLFAMSMFAWRINTKMEKNPTGLPSSLEGGAKAGSGASDI